MIEIKQPTNMRTAVISAVIFEGLSVKKCDGRAARLAIIDESGNVIEAGEEVAAAAWNVVIDCYKNFLIGQGHLRVYAGPSSSGPGKAAA